MSATDSSGIPMCHSTDSMKGHWGRGARVRGREVCKRCPGNCGAVGLTLSQTWPDSLTPVS